ncbi:MAG TPA: hypothetical protein VIM70_08640 [Clostridium sp.]|uniref:hypothetical protein n=1 Tax=Clostridium sp. TaxID=1506 RepID=UPI002F95EFEC
MDKAKIENLLISNGFNKSNLEIGEGVKVFENIYLKDNKEAYILFDGLISEESIYECQKKILWFQNWNDNEVLRYNINILIPYKSSQVNKKEVNKYIFKFERDSHICRKIFLNLDNDNCIDLLPFNKIQLSDSKVSASDLKKEIINILNTDIVYKELLKDEFDLDLLKKELFSR